MPVVKVIFSKLLRTLSWILPCKRNLTNTNRVQFKPVSIYFQDLHCLYSKNVKRVKKKEGTMKLKWNLKLEFCKCQWNGTVIIFFWDIYLPYIVWLTEGMQLIRLKNTQLTIFPLSGFAKVGNQTTYKCTQTVRLVLDPEYFQ